MAYSFVVVALDVGRSSSGEVLRAVVDVALPGVYLTTSSLNDSANIATDAVALYDRPMNIAYRIGNASWSG